MSGLVQSGILPAYRFNLAYARALATGIDPATAAQSAGPGLESHPVFILGHLCTGAAYTAKYLGGDVTLPEPWFDMFGRRGPNDHRLPDTGAAYPSLDEAIGELERQHEAVEALLAGFPEARLPEPSEWRLDEYLPTYADLLLFMCVTHEALHLGQFAAWRRAKGMPSAMATM